MYGEAKKIHLLEAILKIENDADLAEVETEINKNKIMLQGVKVLKTLQEYGQQQR
jgi:predicted aspartyl protease